MYKINDRREFDVQRNDGVHTDVRIPVTCLMQYVIDRFPEDRWEIWISQSLIQKPDHAVTVTLNYRGFTVPYVFTDNEIHELMAFVRDANITEILWEGANIS